MQLEDYFEFHTEPVEFIRIKGTRIDIDHVIELHQRHMTPEQIAVHFGCPLDPALVYATIAYYLLNRAEVEEYLERREQKWQVTHREYLAREASEPMQRIRAIKAARGAGQADAS